MGALPDDVGRRDEELLIGAEIDLASGPGVAVTAVRAIRLTYPEGKTPCNGPRRPCDHPSSPSTTSVKLPFGRVRDDVGDKMVGKPQDVNTYHLSLPSKQLLP